MLFCNIDLLDENFERKRGQYFGQFTLCRACREETSCVAARSLALRRGKEMGGHIGPPLR